MKASSIGDALISMSHGWLGANVDKELTVEGAGTGRLDHERWFRVPASAQRKYFGRVIFGRKAIRIERYFRTGRTVSFRVVVRESCCFGQDANYYGINSEDLVARINENRDVITGNIIRLNQQRGI
jgi:hypothetical protein